MTKKAPPRGRAFAVKINCKLLIVNYKLIFSLPELKYDGFGRVLLR